MRCASSDFRLILLANSLRRGSSDCKASPTVAAPPFEKEKSFGRLSLLSSVPYVFVFVL
jgi:hypothetical protein